MSVMNDTNTSIAQLTDEVRALCLRKGWAWTACRTRSTSLWR